MVARQLILQLIILLNKTIDLDVKVAAHESALFFQRLESFLYLCLITGFKPLLNLVPLDDN